MKNIADKIRLFGSMESIGNLCFMYVAKKMNPVFAFINYYTIFITQNLREYTKTYENKDN